MDRHEWIWALLERGSAHEREHDLGPARQLLTEALEAASAAGMWDVAVNCHQLLGVVAHKADRLDEARTHLDAALALALDAGDRTHEAYAHQELGFVLLDGGDPRLALDEFHTELALAPGAMIINLAGNALSGMGVAMLQLGRVADAVPYLLAALAIRTEIDDLEQQHVDLVHLASAALVLGDSTTAARIARFIDNSPDTAKGMYGHDRRALWAVLRGTACADADPAEGFDDARRLTIGIGAAARPLM
jgi:tetratricopeptide (TPR) repeat protein